MTRPAPRALIRSRRKTAGLTQAELGERIGIGMRQIVRYELGESFPTEETAARMVDVLGGDVADYVRPADFDAVPDEHREIERLRRRNRELERRLEAVEAAMASLVDQVEERRRSRR